jgi:pimeloyl-ACP methyl ester carboxylesterase
MKTLLFLLFTVTSLAAAADGLLLDLIVPPGETDRFQHAEFSCWLPDPSKPVKAVIIHQHGCTSASPEKHPPVTSDWHWRALARKHDAALLVPMYQVSGDCADWNDPDSGSERALFTALEDFAQRSGCAGLKDAPWLLWGHSGGSSWSTQMIVRHPQRVLAASFRGGCHKQFGVPEFRAKFGPVARELPLLFVWGKRESVPASSHFVSWEPMNTMYRELRGQGGKVCRVIDPRSEHGCDDSRLMSITFFDAVLAGQASSAPSTDASAPWLPNDSFAALWKEFSEHGTLKTKSPPLHAPSLTAKREAKGVHLAWRIVPNLDGGLRAIRLHRDGTLWKEIGIDEDAFLATGRDSTPEELRAHSLVDESKDPHSYTLTFLDVGGNESPPSEAVRVP